MKQHSKEK